MVAKFGVREREQRGREEHGFVVRVRNEQDDAGVVDRRREGGRCEEGRGGPEDEVEDGSESEGREEVEWEGEG